MTKAERMLWSILSGRKCGGRKFRRQHAIEPYIVDFFCAEAKLVVVIDGESHDGRRHDDRRRDEYLENLGLRVMRFTNGDLLENLDGVAPPPTPPRSPAVGRSTGRGARLGRLVSFRLTYQRQDASPRLSKAVAPRLQNAQHLNSRIGFRCSYWQLETWILLRVVRHQDFIDLQPSDRLEATVDDLFA